MSTPELQSPNGMADLRLRYALRLKGQIDTMSGVWQSLYTGEATADALDTFYFLAHKISGSGAFFGYQALSDAALELEIELIRVKQLGSFARASEDDREQLDRLFQTLRGLAARADAVTEEHTA